MRVPRPERPIAPTAAIVVIFIAIAPVAPPFPAAAQEPAAEQTRTLPDSPVGWITPYTTDADVRFMTAMLAHHRQGLEMVELALDRAVRPGLRTLAGRIRSNYQDESTMIRLWLRDLAEPVSTVLERSTYVTERHGAFGDFPNMLTPAEMAALRDARGSDFDALFLWNAILHHTAALQLVDTLMASPAAARDQTVGRIVASIEGEQSSYIGHMRRMLRETLAVENRIDSPSFR